MIYTYSTLSLANVLEALHQHHDSLVDAGLIIALIASAKKGLSEAVTTSARTLRWVRRAMKAASKKALGLNIQGSWVFNT